MRLPSDFISRLKSIAHHERSFGYDTNRILAGWTTILIIGLLLIVLSGVYSAYRFYYWAHLEEWASTEKVANAEYNEGAIADILVEFDQKASITKSLLEGAPPPPVDVSTSTTEDIEE